MEDVAVEQDSEQKIMVFQVQYMVAVAEAVKNWIGTKLMSKAETRKDLEAGLEKMLKERRQRLKRRVQERAEEGARCRRCGCCRAARAATAAGGRRRPCHPG